MIHSGLVNQRRGGGFENGYPSQRINHPRDQEMRPWVSGFDLPVMEKSQFATPSAPEGSSKEGVPVKASAQVFYNDIFGKSLSPNAKYYLSQLVKRVGRGGGIGGGGTDGGGGPGGMGGPQRPTGPNLPPPGQVPIPGLPTEGPGQGPGEMPLLFAETDDTDANVDIPYGDYTIANLMSEERAEVEYEDIFYDTNGEPQHERTHPAEVTSSGPTTEERPNAFNAKKYESLLSQGRKQRAAKSNKPLII